MRYRLFLDETGDHGLRSIDENFPIFALCGILVSEDGLAAIEGQVAGFKRKYFGTADVILHSSDIRRCEKSFQILFDQEVKRAFYEDLNRIISGGDYRVIASVVHKRKHIEKYGKTAQDPYSLSLSFVLERSIFCVEAHKDAGDRIDVCIERRGKREDSQLLAEYNRVRSLGTGFVDAARVQGRITDFDPRWKHENIVGLQMADLVAYPIARHVIAPSVPYPTYPLIEPKLYCSPGGRINGYGLKVFP